MSAVLINKYRPKSFDEVVGHGAIKIALEKAIQKGRAHTFLFTGPAGTGKTTLARLTAKKLGCAAVDIQEVDAATNTGIDAMRVIADGMNYGPIGGKAKAIIVDEVHALSKQAFQSLLKALEEPPEWGYWMLCTTEPTKIPANIKSRCFHVALKPIAKTALVELLKNVAQKEKLSGKALKGIIDLCAEQAEGSPRQALTNLAVVAEAKTIDEAEELLENADQSTLAIDLARAISKPFNWSTVQPILAGLKDQNPESIRQVVRAYFTSIAIKVPRGPTLEHALNVLEVFSEPINYQDGITPIVVACARLRS